MKGNVIEAKNLTLADKIKNPNWYDRFANLKLEEVKKEHGQISVEGIKSGDMEN